MASALDVFDGFFGARPSREDLEALTWDRCAELAELLVDFYWATKPQAPAVDELRVSVSSGALVSTMLLYAHSAAMEDPVSEWLCTDFFDALKSEQLLTDGKLTRRTKRMDSAVARDREIVTRELSGAYARLSQWRPLIESEALIPCVQSRHELTRLRGELKGVADYYMGFDLYRERVRHGELGSMDLTPTQREYLIEDLERSEVWELAEGDRQLHGLVSKRSSFSEDSEAAAAYAVVEYRKLERARQAFAQFIPITNNERLYCRHALKELKRSYEFADGSDLRVFEALRTFDIPIVKDATIEAIAVARSESDAFEEWRGGLRNAIRAVQAMPTDQSFAAESSEALEDYLRPQVSKVRDEMSRKSRFAKSTSRELRNLTFGTAVVGAAVGGGIVNPAALAALPLSAVSRVAAETLMNPRSESTGTVLATLMKRS